LHIDADVFSVKNYLIDISVKNIRSSPFLDGLVTFVDVCFAAAYIFVVFISQFFMVTSSTRIP